MSDDTTSTTNSDGAKSVIARRIAWHAIHRADAENDWSGHPDIGEYDWADIVDEVEGIADRQNPSNAEYDAAYALLKVRAEHV